MVIRGRRYTFTAPIVLAATATTAAVGTGTVYAMSEPVQLALIAIVVPTATIIVGFLTLWLKQRSDAKAAADKAEADRKAIAEAAALAATEHLKALEKVEAKADTITHLVDGTASKQDARIQMLLEKVDALTTRAAEDKATRDDLARAAATTAQISAAAGAVRTRATDQPPALTAENTVAVDEAIEKLKKIDSNTKATADNTARTDQTVQDLKDAK